MNRLTVCLILHSFCNLVTWELRLVGMDGNRRFMFSSVSALQPLFSTLQIMCRLAFLCPWCRVFRSQTASRVCLSVHSSASLLIQIQISSCSLLHTRDNFHDTQYECHATRDFVLLLNYRCPKSLEPLGILIIFLIFIYRLKLKVKRLKMALKLDERVDIVLFSVVRDGVCC
jgi:hypothetical protein